MGKHWKLEDKKKILEFYSKNRLADTLIKYGIKNKSTIYMWKQQLDNGTLSSSKSGKGKGSHKGRPKKWKSLNPEEMTREQLIKYVKALEDLKKLEASLEKINSKKLKN